MGLLQPLLRDESQGEIGVDFCLAKGYPNCGPSGLTPNEQTYEEHDLIGLISTHSSRVFLDFVVCHNSNRCIVELLTFLITDHLNIMGGIVLANFNFSLRFLNFSSHLKHLLLSVFGAFAELDY